MEAPEIIWLSPNEYRSNEPSCFWSESQRTDYDIKYISKDSFIEKALLWLEKNFDSYSYPSHLMFDDFREYLDKD